MIAQPKRQPTISLLLVSRDEGENLVRTLRSVLSSTRVPDEVILIDDASQIPCAETLTAHPDLPPIRHFRHEQPRGLIAARDRAAREARGDILVFLDAHCWVSKNWIEGSVDLLRKIDFKGIASPVIYDLDPERWEPRHREFGIPAWTVPNCFLDFIPGTPRVIDGVLSSCVIGGMAWSCSAKPFMIVFCSV